MSDDDSSGRTLRGLFTPKTSVGAETRWKKGAGSPNPGGRRKSQMVLIRKAREHVGEAIDYAYALMRDEDADKRTRLDAAKFLTAYGLGAPPKIINDDADAGSDTMGELTVDELRALARQSLADDAPETDDAGDDDSDETEH